MSAMGVLFVWYVFCDLGVMTFVSKARASHNQADVHGALRLNAGTSVLGGVVAILLCATLPASTSPELAIGLGILALALALEKNTDTALCLPIADGNRSTPAISLTGRRIVSTIVFVGLLFLYLDPILAYSLGYLAGAFAAQVHVRQYLRRSRVEGVGATPARTIARRATPFLITNVSVQSRSFDTAIVGILASPAASGLYAAASKITAPFMLVPSTLTSLVLPHAVRAGVERAWAISLKLTAGAAVLGVALIPVSMLAEPIIVFLLGADYAAASSIMRWLLFGLPFVALSSPLSAVLQALHAERFVAKNSVAFALVSLGLVAIGALIAGGTGAAIATSVTFIAKCTSLLIAIYILVRRSK